MTSALAKGLPPLLAQVAEITGEAGALRLLAAFGGQEIKVPKIPRPGQVLWERCGRDVAEALAHLRGGEDVAIPNASALRSKKQAILRAVGSANRVAFDTGATSRYVRMVKSDPAPPLPLFDRIKKRD